MRGERTRHLWHLAGLVADEVGQRLLVAGDDVAGGGHDVGAFGDRTPPPGALGLGRGGHRGVDGGGVVHRVLAHDVVGAGGVDGAEGRHASCLSHGGSPPGVGRRNGAGAGRDVGPGPGVNPRNL